MSEAAQAAPDPADLSSALAELLTREQNTPTTVENLRRLTGGASHETWAFDARNGRDTRALVLRRDFPDPLIGSDIAAEFSLLQSLHAVGIRVATPVYCDCDGRDLGSPGMIVERVEGSDLRKAMASGLPATLRDSLARECVDVQLAIHGLGSSELQALPVRRVTEEIEQWAGPLLAERSPRPLLTAALAWLCDRQLVIDAPVLVHGDLKANNLLLDPAGGLTVIDWEMAHLGDPLEDLAWTMLWHTADDIVGGLMSRDAYLDAYAASSGGPIDPERLSFWEMFSLVKLAAIFVTGAPDKRDEPARPVCLQLRRALPWIESRLADELGAGLAGAAKR